MRRLICLILAFLGLTACAPASKPADSPAPQQFDFKCTATTSEGVKIEYRYYKHIVDATAVGMGMRNFVWVEVQIDDRFESRDINEESEHYNEKVIYINTIRGPYEVKTNYATNGGIDSAIVAKHLDTEVVFASMSCN